MLPDGKNILSFLCGVEILLLCHPVLLVSVESLEYIPESMLIEAGGWSAIGSSQLINDLELTIS